MESIKTLGVAAPQLSTQTTSLVFWVGVEMLLPSGGTELLQFHLLLKIIDKHISKY